MPGVGTAIALGVGGTTAWCCYYFAPVVGGTFLQGD